jgi:hypothetical protein
MPLRPLPSGSPARPTLVGVAGAYAAVVQEGRADRFRAQTLTVNEV